MHVKDIQLCPALSGADPHFIIMSHDYCHSVLEGKKALYATIICEHVFMSETRKTFQRDNFLITTLLLTETTVIVP